MREKKKLRETYAQLYNTVCMVRYANFSYLKAVLAEETIQMLMVERSSLTGIIFILDFERAKGQSEINNS